MFPQRPPLWASSRLCTHRAASRHWAFAHAVLAAKAVFSSPLCLSTSYSPFRPQFSHQFLRKAFCSPRLGQICPNINSYHEVSLLCGISHNSNFTFSYMQLPNIHFMAGSAREAHCELGACLLKGGREDGVSLTSVLSTPPYIPSLVRVPRSLAGWVDWPLPALPSLTSSAPCGTSPPKPHLEH